MTIRRLSVALVAAALLAMAPEVGQTFAPAWSVGDVFVGIGDPYLNATHKGEYLVFGADGVSRNQTIRDSQASYTTGCYYNPSTQSLWTTSFDGLTVGEYDGTRWVRRIDLSTIAGALAVESIAFGNTDNFFVGMPYAASPNIAEFTRNGALVRTLTVPPPPDGQGFTNGVVDWLDVDIDPAGHRIIYYTDESLRDERWHTTHPGYQASIYRYDADALQFLGRFAQLPDTTLFALRVLPNHDGVLVAAPGGIHRLNSAGTIVASFGAPGETGFYALNIAPDGQHFWTASAKTGRVYKFHIPSQQLVLAFNSGSPVVNGLCVVREYTAVEDKCTAEDGSTIACPKLEICGASIDSNGDGILDTSIDDDGDGLPDSLDPDCGSPGISNFEGDTVSRSLALPPGPGETLTYSATGLPPGLSIDSSGLVTSFDALTNTPTVPYNAAGTYPVTLTVLHTGGATSTTTNGTFKWTIADVNRRPVVALPAPQTTAEGNVQTLQIVASDPDTAVDHDTLNYALAGPSWLSIDPASGLITAAPGYDATMPPATTLPVTVTVTDSHNPGPLSASVEFTWTATNVNRPPTATPPIVGVLPTNQAVTLILAGSDPDNDPFTFVGVTIPSGFTLTTTGTLSGSESAAGTYHFEFKTRDSGGLESPVAAFDLVFVNNRPPDCSGAAASVPAIWPPNGRLIRESVLGVTDPDPNDTVSITIIAIAQDEPTNTKGDGNTSQDGQIAGSIALVRAERAGTPNAPGDGRVYRISFIASDGNGGSCAGNVFVGVPHDQRGVPALPGTTWYNSLTGGPVQ